MDKESIRTRIMVLDKEMEMTKNNIQNGMNHMNMLMGAKTELQYQLGEMEKKDAAQSGEVEKAALEGTIQ